MKKITNSLVLEIYRGGGGTDIDIAPISLLQENTYKYTHVIYNE